MMITVVVTVVLTPFGATELTGPPLEAPKTSKGEEYGEGFPLQSIRGLGKDLVVYT